MTEPMKALTITPCWAHAFVHLEKAIESRTWAPSYRGPLLIQAGKAFNADEFERICRYAKEDRKDIPNREDIRQGGIIGIVDFYTVVVDSDSPWFGGPYGGVFRKIRATPYLAMKGQLGLFNVDPPSAWRKQIGL